MPYADIDWVAIVTISLLSWLIMMVLLYSQLSDVGAAFFCGAPAAVLAGRLSFLHFREVAYTIRFEARTFMLQWTEERERVLKTAAGALSRSDPQGALETIEDAKTRGFVGHEFDVLKARSLYELGRFEEAASLLVLVSESRQGMCETTEVSALSHIDANTTKASLGKLESLLSRLDIPERSLLLKCLVRSAGGPRRHDSAGAAVMRLALAQMPDDADTVYAAAQYAKADGDLELACARLRKLPMCQHTPESLALWATSLAALNGMDYEAEMVYAHYLQSNPSDAVVRVVLGNILVREKRYEEAERLYRAGIELDPSNPRFRYNRALTLMQAGLYDSAIGTLQSFMKTDSWESYRSKGDVHRIMGMCMMRQGTLSQALKQFQMADRSVQTLDRLYELAGMFELQGDLKSARACYDEVYAEDVTYKDVAAKIRTT